MNMRSKCVSFYICFWSVSTLRLFRIENQRYAVALNCTIIFTLEPVAQMCMGIDCGAVSFKVKKVSSIFSIWCLSVVHAIRVTFGLL